MRKLRVNSTSRYIKYKVEKQGQWTRYSIIQFKTYVFILYRLTKEMSSNSGRNNTFAVVTIELDLDVIITKRIMQVHDNGIRVRWTDTLHYRLFLELDA